MTQLAPSNDAHDAVRLKRRPWWSRMSAAQVFMIVAGILAFLANLVLLRGQEDVEFVAVAAVDLNPGIVLDATEHLRFVEVDGSSDLVGRSVLRDEVGAFEGFIVTASLRTGDLVNRSQLREAAASGDLRAMSVPVDPANAAGGRIAVGDRVDVIAVDDGVARYVLVGSEVIERSPETSGSALGGSGSFFIVVGVTADQALELASAMDRADIQIVRSTGASVPTRLTLDPADETATTEGGDREDSAGDS